jgi:hypothetical protein
MRRFDDPVGLWDTSYPVLLALALFAWYEGRGRRGDARYILFKVFKGPTWFKSRIVGDLLDQLDAWGYLEFECQNPFWKPMGWYGCPRAWRLSIRGRERLETLLSNLGLTVDGVLGQPSPLDVKNLIDSRIKAVYREHWERVRRYEEVVAGEGGL